MFMAFFIGAAAGTFIGIGLTTLVFALALREVADRAIGEL